MVTLPNFETEDGGVFDADSKGVFQDQHAEEHDCQAMFIFQEECNIKRCINDLCHALLGRDLSNKDRRKTQVPIGLAEGIQGLLAMFSVDENQQRACFPQKFKGGGWREVTYKEISRLRPRTGEFSEYEIKRLLRVLEKHGIITRARRWFAAVRRKVLYIRFHADRLMKFINDQIPLMLKMKKKARKTVSVSTAIDRRINSTKTTPLSSPGAVAAAPVAPASDVPQDKVDKPVSQAPPVNLSFKKKEDGGTVMQVDEETYAVLNKLRHYFPAEQFTDRNVKKIRRMVNHPLPAWRMSPENLQQYLDLRDLNKTTEKEWMWECEDLAIFLPGWRKIWKETRLVVKSSKFVYADGMRDRIKQVIGDLEFVMEEFEHCRTLDDLRFKSYMNDRNPLYIVARFWRAMQLGIDPAELGESLRNKMRDFFESAPSLYLVLRDKLPVAVWARISGSGDRLQERFGAEQYADAYRMKLLEDYLSV